MEEISIAFVGDIMPGGVLHYSNKSFINKDVAAFFNGFDIRVGTLECALGDDFDYYQNLMDELGRTKNSVYAKSVDIKKVKELRIDVVTIANNHIFDLGREGLINTVTLLNQNNIKYCGAGINIDEASKPAVVEIKGKSVAFLGCADIIPSSPYPAGKDKAGFNPLNPEKIFVDIKKAKEIYDYVFVLPHWGIEHRKFPLLESKQIACKMIDAGADGVFGGHTHSVQPNIVYKRKPVVFSMGNFLFPDRFVQPPAPTYYPETTVGLENIPIARTAKCTTISRKTWRPSARFGLIVGVFINDSIQISKRLTILSASDVIEFVKPAVLPLNLLNMRGVLVQYFYKPIIIRNLFSVRTVLRKIIKGRTKK